MQDPSAILRTIGEQIEAKFSLLEERLHSFEKRLADLESDAEGMPAYANPHRYHRITSGGKSLDGLGPEIPCPMCKGKGFNEATDSYEKDHYADANNHIRCRVCQGTGMYRYRLSTNELEALKEEPTQS